MLQLLTGAEPHDLGLGLVQPQSVVKLLSKRWWIPIGATPKLEPEGPRAEVGFPTAEHSRHSVWLLWHLNSV